MDTSRSPVGTVTVAKVTLREDPIKRANDRVRAPVRVWAARPNAQGRLDTRRLQRMANSVLAVCLSPGDDPRGQSRGFPQLQHAQNPIAGERGCDVLQSMAANGSANRKDRPVKIFEELRETVEPGDDKDVASARVARGQQGRDQQ